MHTFDSLAIHLNHLMAEQYIAVNPEKNPVAQLIYRASFSELVYVVQQYTIFPEAIVFFAQSARNKAVAAGWLDVAKELQENIAEELGSSTQGISHSDLLVKGLEEGLQLSIKGTSPSTATRQLLKTMVRFCNQDVAFVFGAMYAIEATSIAELTIVLQLIEHLLEGALPPTLTYFFDMHLNHWEMEHEEDLRKTLAVHINHSCFEQFEAGFRAVMEMMDLWWIDLAREASLQIDVQERSAFASGSIGGIA